MKSSQKISEYSRMLIEFDIDIDKLEAIGFLEGMEPREVADEIIKFYLKLIPEYLKPFEKSIKAKEYIDKLIGYRNLIISIQSYPIEYHRLFVNILLMVIVELEEFLDKETMEIKDDYTELSDNSEVRKNKIFLTDENDIVRSQIAYLIQKFVSLNLMENKPTANGNSIGPLFGFSGSKLKNIISEDFPIKRKKDYEKLISVLEKLLKETKEDMQKEFPEK